jgi:hypothetical protein
MRNGCILPMEKAGAITLPHIEKNIHHTKNSILRVCETALLPFCYSFTTVAGMAKYVRAFFNARF